MREIDLKGTEDITLVSEEAEPVKVNKVNEKFRQENKLKGEVREFTVFNGAYCSQSVSRKHGKQQNFRVDLTILDPVSKRNFVLAHGWLFTAAISVVLSFLLIYAGWFSSMHLNNGVMVILASLSLTSCAIFFLVSILRSRDRIILSSQFGRVPVLELINKKPGGTTFSSFINTLSSYIQTAKYNDQLNTKDRLIKELREIRRLKEESVIAEDDYERAKKKILQHKAFTDPNPS